MSDENLQRTNPSTHGPVPFGWNMMTFIMVLICLFLQYTASPTMADAPEKSETEPTAGIQTDLPPGVTLDAIIKRLDELYRSNTAYAEMEMAIETPHWKRTLTMKCWSQGLEETFIVIETPRREKGISTLRKGNEMWNFFPKINKVMKVPPSMMMGSWMGSDFTNDDLVKESTRIKDYHARLIPGENQNCYHVAFTPRETTVSLWGKIISGIDKKSLLPVYETFYDEKDRKIRMLYFKEVKTFGTKTIPAVMELIPFTKKNHKTTIRYTTAVFDTPLDKETFTLRNLEKKRR